MTSNRFEPKVGKEEVTHTAQRRVYFGPECIQKMLEEKARELTGYGDDPDLVFEATITRHDNERQGVGFSVGVYVTKYLASPENDGADKPLDTGYRTC